MIEAAMIWNEPNNKSHWDPELDPDWSLFAAMAACAGRAIRAEHPALPRVLGGISPIDPLFIRRMVGYGVLEHVDAVAVHGFPLDWNLWQIHDWPAKVDEIRAVTDKPIWVSEVGISTFGAPSSNSPAGPGATPAPTRPSTAARSARSRSPGRTAPLRTQTGW